MRCVALSSLLLSAIVSADVVPVDRETYLAAEASPVLAHAIFSAYEQAMAICDRSGKAVATMRLDQHVQPQQWPAAELRFQCVSKASTCAHGVPPGAHMSTEGIILKNGTVLNYERCSDEEAKLEKNPTP
jgi:hypothetical protein